MTRSFGAHPSQLLSPVGSSRNGSIEPSVAEPAKAMVDTWLPPSPDYDRPLAGHDQAIDGFGEKYAKQE